MLVLVTGILFLEVIYGDLFNDYEEMDSFNDDYSVDYNSLHADTSRVRRLQLDNPITQPISNHQGLINLTKYSVQAQDLNDMYPSMKLTPQQHYEEEYVFSPIVLESVRPTVVQIGTWSTEEPSRIFETSKIINKGPHEVKNSDTVTEEDFNNYFTKTLVKNKPDMSGIVDKPTFKTPEVYVYIPKIASAGDDRAFIQYDKFKKPSGMLTRTEQSKTIVKSSELRNEYIKHSDKSSALDKSPNRIVYESIKPLKSSSTSHILDRSSKLEVFETYFQNPRRWYMPKSKTLKVPTKSAIPRYLPSVLRDVKSDGANSHRKDSSSKHAIKTNPSEISKKLTQSTLKDKELNNDDSSSKNRGKSSIHPSRSTNLPEAKMKPERKQLNKDDLSNSEDVYKSQFHPNRSTKLEEYKYDLNIDNHLKPSIQQEISTKLILEDDEYAYESNSESILKSTPPLNEVTKFHPKSTEQVEYYDDDISNGRNPTKSIQHTDILPKSKGQLQKPDLKSLKSDVPLKIPSVLIPEGGEFYNDELFYTSHMPEKSTLGAEEVTYDKHSPTRSSSYLERSRKPDLSHRLKTEYLQNTVPRRVTNKPAKKSQNLNRMYARNFFDQQKSTNTVVNRHRLTTSNERALEMIPKTGNDSRSRSPLLQRKSNYIDVTRTRKVTKTQEFGVTSYTVINKPEIHDNELHNYDWRRDMDYSPEKVLLKVARIGNNGDVDDIPDDKIVSSNPIILRQATTTQPTTPPITQSTTQTTVSSTTQTTVSSTTQTTASSTTPTTTTVTTTTVTTTTTTPPTTVIRYDVARFLAILANLTYDYDTNLTMAVNMTLMRLKWPTCGTYTPPTTTTTTTTAPVLDYSGFNGTLVAKCFVCGLESEEIPFDAECADAFAGDFIPLVPQDPRARSRVARFRKYCRLGNVRNYYINSSFPRSMYGEWTGGCSVRWTDLTGVYTQRTCRNKGHPTTGRHFASKRMAKLEMALLHEDNGCIISPVATLLPLSRGISLFARFHACVCTGSWCNSAPRRVTRHEARAAASYAILAYIVSFATV